MKTHLGSSEITPLEWISVNQFLHEIKNIDSHAYLSTIHMVRVKKLFLCYMKQSEVIHLKE